jgi:hypothetical protein
MEMIISMAIQSARIVDGSIAVVNMEWVRWVEGVMRAGFMVLIIHTVQQRRSNERVWKLLLDGLMICEQL